ncbi:MAG: O-antigen ligase family protein [Candidatus Moranbacteria bacterium]|nr:O-antigen ligase family protein [Candidatus Moranbacteria bacterium]
MAESLLGIIQFLRQRSLGLSFLKESVIDPSMPGVAKIIVDGSQYIRSYGTFPHPNIFAGFLLISIIVSHFYLKQFHVEQNRVRVGNVIVLLVQYVGIVLTFSKSAIIGLGLALMYVGVVSRGTQSDMQLMGGRFLVRMKNLFHVKHHKWIILTAATGVGIIIAGFLLNINADALFFQSLRERDLYQKIAIDVIQKYSILGISCGQLVIFMSQQGIYPLLEWQLQPVHNVFLLVWAELGVGGFCIFLLWYLLVLVSPVRDEKQRRRSRDLFMQVVSRGTDMFARMEVYWRAIVWGMLPVLLFDHYLWDIQQGQLMLWLVMGMSVGCILHHKSIY